MKEYILIFDGQKITCKSFFIVEMGTEGIDIYNEDNTRIDEMLDISIPDTEDKEECEHFETKVTNFIKEKYGSLCS